MAIESKHHATESSFWSALSSIETVFPRDKYLQLKADTVAEVRQVVGSSRAAYGWSGGKDSIALGAVCRQAGVHRSMFARTNLEYPEFIRWVEKNRPPGLSVVNTGQDLKWLAEHQDLLFPTDSRGANRWGAMVQRRAQDVYYAAERLEMMILGRRKVDGNQVGEDTGLSQGFIYRTKKGRVRYNPIGKWSHEATLAAMCYEGFMDNLPPCYFWPRGFRTGTGPWPKRRCDRADEGWSEVYQIDPDIVREAATLILSARDFLGRVGDA